MQLLPDVPVRVARLDVQSSFSSPCVIHYHALTPLPSPFLAKLNIFLQ